MDFFGQKHTTRLVYGVDIFRNTNLSSIALIPYSEDDLPSDISQNILVNKESFGKSIFLLYEDLV
ncbi:MAG: hypothetical protein SFU98_02330 [Leptospiraceae bacterium]|nr:hypothetical protein [Leptospiraceae bacterium]